MKIESRVHWNYRIVKRTYSNASDECITYSIHECYYIDGKPVSITEDPIPIFGESIEELLAVNDKMGIAFSKPVLNYEDF